MGNKKLSLFSLTMLNITAIISLSSIAYMATIGLQSIVFYLIAAFMFLIPSGLVCAELGGMMTKDNGGIFTWVKEAFGEKTGMVAMWMEWFNNTIGFPGWISAIIATIAYVAFNSVMKDGIEMWIIMVTVFFLVTCFNFLPMKKVVLLNIFGAIFGMILPGILIISGAIYYLVIGNSHISYNGFNDFVPILSFATFALLVKTLSAYSGIQSVAFHMKNVQNPKENIPKSILIAVIVIVILTILSTLALMVIVPVKDVNPLNGLIQGIVNILEYIGLQGAEFPVAILIGLGMLASLSTWVLGPARGMQEAAEQKLFPKICEGKNKHGMPVNMLMIQFIIVVILSCTFLVMPSIESAFAMLVALTSQFTVIMWALVFASAIRLRYKQKNAIRVFHIGKRGSNKFIILICVLAIITCLSGFILGLYPPHFSHLQNVTYYIIAIAITDLIIIMIPLIWVYIHHKKKNRVF